MYTSFFVCHAVNLIVFKETLGSLFMNGLIGY